MTKFHGVVPPVVTPLNPDFTVDYPSYTRVLEHLIEAGCHGVFVLGSTSEVVFHDERTRQEILEHTVKVVNGRVPVIAGVIDPTTDRVIAHAKVAKAAGADAVVVTAPFYTVTSQSEIIDHFRYIKDAVDIPLVAYDIPVCVHVKLARSTVTTLAREGAIIGLKDSSGDDGNFRYALARSRRAQGRLPDDRLRDRRRQCAARWARTASFPGSPMSIRTAMSGSGMRRSAATGSRRARSRSGSAACSRSSGWRRAASAAARPASAASRPPCAASASSTRTSCRGPAQPLECSRERRRIDAILRSTGLLD